MALRFFGVCDRQRDKCTNIRLGSSKNVTVLNIGDRLHASFFCINKYKEI